MPSGTTDNSLFSIWSETNTLDRTYCKAFRSEEGLGLFVGGQTQDGGSITEDRRVTIFRVTGVTEEPDGSRTVAYSWTRLNHLLTTGAMNFGAVLIHDDLFVLGGHDGVEGATLDTFNIVSYRKSPSLNEFVEKDAAPFTVAGHSMVAMSDDTAILVTGGFSDWNVAIPDVWEYEISTDTWTQKNDMIEPRLHHESVLISRGPYEGYVMVIGGRRPVTAGQDVYFDRPTIADTQAIGPCLASCEIFNPGGNAWIQACPMAYARFGFGMVSLPDGRIMVFGGYGYRSTDPVTPVPLTSCEVYDPISRLWASLPDMATARAFPVVAYMPERNEIVVSGGRGTTSHEILSLRTLTWKHGIQGLSGALHRSVGARVGDDFLLMAGGSALSEDGDFDDTQALGFILVPGVEKVWAGGLNTQAVVRSVDDPNTFTYETPDYAFYTKNGADDVVVTPVKAQPSTIPGPYTFDSKNGLAITDIEGTVDTKLEQGRQYAVLTLRETPVTDEEPATKFPDQEGFLAFNFGGKVVGPVRYYGRLSENELKLDFSFKFPHDVEAGTTVHYLSQREPFQPSRTNLVGAFYATASAAGRRAASETVDGTVAAGVDVKKTISYPGDRGLGGEGFPDRLSNKLSDRVSVWGGDDLTDEIDNARKGND